MFVNDFDGDPYSEVQHILEVLERGNPVKGISREGGIIQIEQTDEKDVQIVLEELKARGYEIISTRRYSNFVVAGIKLKERQKEEPKEIGKPKGGIEPGD